MKFSHPIRGELEVRKHGRDYLETNFVRSKKNPFILCMPQMTFVDGFGLYRNMYQSLLGFYLIPSNLTLREETRVANIFLITLGPQGLKLEQTLKCLKPAFLKVDKGLQIYLDYDKDKVFVASFLLEILGDMPQQNACSGFKS